MLREKDGKTMLTLRGRPLNATDEERATFVDMFPSMQQGFGGTFDQLEAYLAAQIAERDEVGRLSCQPRLMRH